jgi:hypothetical protein
MQVIKMLGLGLVVVLPPIGRKVEGAYSGPHRVRALEGW